MYTYTDNAYQGFASGDLDADAAPVRLFMQSTDDSSIEMLVACSFSKNMGLCKYLNLQLKLHETVPIAALYGTVVLKLVVCAVL
jgi:Aminotransferase class I and II